MPLNSRNSITLTDEALRIHRDALVLDGHNDMPHRILDKGLSLQPGFSLNDPQPELQTDIPRLQKGGVNAQVWAAYVSPGYIETGGANQACLEQLELIHQLVKKHPEQLGLATSVAEIETIRNQGKIASLIGVEGGHAIEHSLDNLTRYYEMGARYMTLTHTASHDWADSGYDESRHGGLSGFGKEVISEMNRLGMLVDISHASDDTVRDALKVSKAPIIASHSSVRAICGSRRNLPDEMIRGIAEKGGIVLVNFFPVFITPKGAEVEQRFMEKSTELKQQNLTSHEIQEAMEDWQKGQPAMPHCSVNEVVAHFEHIIVLAGIDHVGLGSDYDGIPYGPDQMPDVSGFPYITQGLLNRGYGEKDIRKILGGNFMRVLAQAELLVSVSP